MIFYCFIRKNKEIVYIKVIGHSLYDIKNYDIVCSAVSTAIIVTLNALIMLDFQKNILFSLKEGFFELKVVNKISIMSILLNNLEYSLKDLEKTYKKNIKENCVI